MSVKDIEERRPPSCEYALRQSQIEKKTLNNPPSFFVCLFAHYLLINTFQMNVTRSCHFLPIAEINTESKKKQKKHSHFSLQYLLSSTGCGKQAQRQIDGDWRRPRALFRGHVLLPPSCHSQAPLVFIFFRTGAHGVKAHKPMHIPNGSPSARTQTWRSWPYHASHTCSAEYNPIYPVHSAPQRCKRD